MSMMNIPVETCSSPEAEERPIRFRLGTRDYFVKELLDQWYGSNDLYFKVQADDGNLYILRHHAPETENESGWFLESFRQASK